MTQERSWIAGLEFTCFRVIRTIIRPILSTKKTRQLMGIIVSKAAHTVYDNEYPDWTSEEFGTCNPPKDKVIS